MLFSANRCGLRYNESVILPGAQTERRAMPGRCGTCLAASTHRPLLFRSRCIQSADAPILLSLAVTAGLASITLTVALWLFTTGRGLKS